MLEILKNFEQVTTTFSPIVLIIPAVAVVLVGLFIWLGGLGFRRVLLAIVGLVSGGSIGYFIISQNFILAAISAMVALLIIMIFQRIFVAILIAFLAATLCFFILARPYLNVANTTTTQGHDRVLRNDSTMSVSESIEITKTYIVNLGEEVKQTFTKMSIKSWLIIAMLALILLVAGFFLSRLAFALCCASLGTILIFVGMVLMLLYKGSMPISKINSRASFYSLIFLVMIGFGTLVQLFLYLRSARQAEKAKQASKIKQESEEKKRSWRNI